jgi:hypothetical protein
MPGAARVVSRWRDTERTSRVRIVTLQRELKSEMVVVVVLKLFGRDYSKMLIGKTHIRSVSLAGFECTDFRATQLASNTRIVAVSANR